MTILRHPSLIIFDFYLKLISSSLMPSQLSYFSLSHALFNPPSYLHISFLSFFLSINTPSFSFAFLYASLFKAFPLSFYSSSFPFLAYFLLLKTISSCVLNILWESTIMWLCVCVCVRASEKLLSKVKQMTLPYWIFIAQERRIAL